jgi:hypothetical protein
MYFGRDFCFQNLFIKKIESTEIITFAAFWKLLRGLWSSTTNRKFSVRNQDRNNGDFMIYPNSCSLVCTNKTRGFISLPEERRVSFPAADRYISCLLSRSECRMVSTTVLYVSPRFKFFFLRQNILYIVFCDYSWSIQPTSE